MIKTNYTRKKIRIITYTVALIVCLTVSTVSLYSKSSRYEYELRAKQQSSVIELAEYVDNISTQLNKGVYADTAPMIAQVSEQLIRDCSCAKTALSQISAPDVFLENTYKFLSQVGDFTASLSNKLQNGSEISAKEREELYSLLLYSKSLSKSVSALIEEYESGTEFNVQTQGISTSLSDIEQSFSSYPSLIYDGPFSDHINQEDAEMLHGLETITENEARKRAANITGLKRNVLLSGEAISSPFECYTFTTESTSISITKNGGYLSTLLTSNRVGEEKLTAAEAVEIGKNFLNSIGYKNMYETYYATDDGICTINYALKIGDIVCYTDLIKVGVALDNGRILAVDAHGYLMNHMERSLTEPKLSSAEAQNNLSPNLKVKSVKRALIPTASDREYLCYEFLCTGYDNEDILVYIDANTGVERQILLLLYSDGGTLTK